MSDKIIKFSDADKILKQTKLSMSGITISDDMYRKILKSIEHLKK